MQRNLQSRVPKPARRSSTLDRDCIAALRPGAVLTLDAQGEHIAAQTASSRIPITDSGEGDGAPDRSNFYAERVCFDRLQNRPASVRGRVCPGTDERTRFL